MIRKRNKYHARKVLLDGFTFDSQAEERRYQELKLLERAGEIERLAVHPVFVLQEAFTDNDGNHQRAIRYEADFSYWYNGGVVVEDVKGVRTPVFRLKEKMFRKRYPSVRFVVLDVQRRS